MHIHTHTYHDLVMSGLWLIALVAPMLARTHTCTHVLHFKHDLLTLLLKLGIIEVLSRETTTSPYTREKGITLLYYSCASEICRQCYIVDCSSRGC